MMLFSNFYLFYNLIRIYIFVVQCVADHYKSINSMFSYFRWLTLQKQFVCVCVKKTLSFGISVHLQNSANETDSHNLYYYTSCINLNFRKFEYVLFYTFLTVWWPELLYGLMMSYKCKTIPRHEFIPINILK